MLMTAQAEKLDFKRVFPLFVIVLIDLLGLTIIIPLLPLYAASFGADPFTIGLINTVYPLMTFVAAPILGGLSDRIGRKPVLVGSQIGTFAGFILLAVANSLPLLLLSRMIDGVSGGNIVAAQAAISDLTTPKTRSAGLGLIGAAFGLGFTLGPAIAGISLALTGNNYHVPALIAAGFSLVSILLSVFWLKETHQPGTTHEKNAAQSVPMLSRVARAFANPATGILLVLIFCQQLIFGGYENLLALFNLNRLGLNAGGNAFLFAFIGIILVVVQGGMIGRLTARFGERRLIYAGLAMLAISGLTIAFTPQQPVPWYSRAELEAELSGTRSSSVEPMSVALPDEAGSGWTGIIWLTIAMIPMSVGASVLSPSINSLLTKRAATQAGGILGISSSLTSAANAITPAIGGSMFQFIGAASPFLIGGLLLGALLGVALFRLHDISLDQTSDAQAR
jgi:DHA1 family tetracycline resistance protein-like MFS transporter